MKWSNYLKIKRLLGAAAIVSLFCLIVIGCKTPAATTSTPGTLQNPSPSASFTPQFTAATDTPAAPTIPVNRADQPVPAEAANSEQQFIDVTATPRPTSADGGIRPAEVVLRRDPETGLESPVEWRPPPIPVPHALHPDDHYWLARPLPSDRRNYDLEWYPYGNRPMRSQALPYRVHHGMDFPNDTGTPIFAASSGEVIWAGPLRSNRDGVNYYGNTVVIKHDWFWQGQDVYTLYAHTLELFVEVGDQVEQGQLIAGVGASGEVSGPHLHFEVRVGENNYSSVRNPALWLAPYDGWGVLAGRFMDSRGRLIHGALITLYPLETEGFSDVPVRRQRTYEPSTVQSDDVWQENFVIADLPAGDYQMVLSTAGEVFRREIRIQPGQTNYVIFQADFAWAPTLTPTLTPTATATLPPEQLTGTPIP
jgi:murein DD-endopeptidase MepM/ murein hydrolase activator NlpD